MLGKSLNRSSAQTCSKFCALLNSSRGQMTSAQGEPSPHIVGGLRRDTPSTLSMVASSFGALRRNATSDEVIDSEASSGVATVVGLVLLCTLLANLVKRIETSRWQCPESILAIILGFFASMPLCSATTRPGKDFDTIFFLYLVPPILFESGYSLKQRDFFRNFTAICLFAVVGTVISSLVAGMSFFYLARGSWFKGLNAASPKEGLLFGTLLSATDTVATIAVLRQMGVGKLLCGLSLHSLHPAFCFACSLLPRAASLPAFRASPAPPLPPPPIADA